MGLTTLKPPFFFCVIFYKTAASRKTPGFWRPHDHPPLEPFSVCQVATQHTISLVRASDTLGCLTHASCTVTKKRKFPPRLLESELPGLWEICSKGCEACRYKERTRSTELAGCATHRKFVAIGKRCKQNFIAVRQDLQDPVSTSIMLITTHWSFSNIIA